MNKPNLSTFIEDAKTVVSRRSPEILIGLGIAGMISSTVLAVRATPKALRLIDEKTEEKGETISKLEAVKACWKCYIPAAISAATSVACIIGASSVHAKRNAALATAYKLAESSLVEYKDSVVKTIGEKKAMDVVDNLSKEKVEKQPVSKSEVFVTKAGNTLCLETISGRYFKSDIERIKRAVNELNRRMLNENYISLSEFYDELDLDHTSISDKLGWDIEKGMIDIYFSSQIADDGTPCIVVNYSTPPTYGFSSFM